MVTRGLLLGLEIRQTVKQLTQIISLTITMLLLIAEQMNRTSKLSLVERTAYFLLIQMNTRST